MSTSSPPSILLARDPNTSSSLSPSKNPFFSAPKPVMNTDSEKAIENPLSGEQHQQQEQQQEEDGKKEKEETEQEQGLEYHRQVLKSRMEAEKGKKLYVSPSDTIMSPCTAKLSAYKSRQFGKAKPQSLFAKMENAKAEKGIDGKEQKEL